MRRRDFLHSAILLSTLGSPVPARAARSVPKRRHLLPFDYAALKGRARALAQSKYQPSADLAPRPLQQLTYDQYQAIRFRRERALWAQDDRAFRVEFFHLGRHFKEPVRMYEIVAGAAQEIRYQDDSVFYEARPSLWIEPKAGWGSGAVQLAELTAPNETFDNIVAYWNPAQPPQPGDELLYGYRMYWGTRLPFAPPLARTVATRTGLGGVVGQERRYFSWRFAVDFAGGELAALPQHAEVEPVISVSRGGIEVASARPLESIRGYRALFDLRPPDDDMEPIDIRMYLRYGRQPLTETWTYQWTPPSPRERRLALNAASAR